MYNQGYLVDTKTAEIFAESGVRLRQFSPPRNGLVDLSLLLSQDTIAGAEEGSTKPEDVREILGDENFVRPIS